MQCIRCLIEIRKNENKKIELKALQKNHHDFADSACQNKSKNKKTAKSSNGSTFCCSFDLQQYLPTSNLTTSESFYKRALRTYNLTFNNNTEKITKCYMWHEAIAKRGGNEVALCIYKFFTKFEG